MKNDHPPTAQLCEQIVASSRTGLFALDCDLKITLWNPFIEKLTGLTETQVLGRTLLEVLPALREEGVAPLLQQALSGERLIAPDLRSPAFALHDEPLWVAIRVEPLCAADGAIFGVLGSLRDISQRKRVEESLHATERRFHALFDNMAEGVALHRTIYNERGEPVNYEILDVNPRYEAVLGLKCEQVAGKLATEVYGVAEVPYLARFTRVGETGQPDSFETYFSPMDRHFAISVAPLGGKLWATIFTDITERKRAEEQLRRFSRLYALLSQVNQIIVRAQPREELFQEICRIAIDFGEFRMAWIGWLDQATCAVRPVAQAGDDQGYLSQLKIYADDRPEGQGLTGTAIRSGTSYVANDFLGDPRLQPWHGLAASRGFRSAGAFPIRVAGEVRGALMLYAGEKDFFREAEVKLLDEVARDISFALDKQEEETCRRIGDEALREAEERYRTLFENAQIGIYRTTPEGRILVANPALIRILGYESFDQLARRNLEQEGFSAGTPREQFREEIDRIGEVRGLESQWLRRDGLPIIVRENARAVRDAAGKVVFYDGTVEDITERKDLEARLRQAQKLEGIGQLAGGVAHDFNNMLTVILGNASVLQGQPGLDSATGELIQQIAEAGERAAHLTRQLLTFSRKTPMKSARLDVNEVVNGLTKMLRRIIGEDIDLECRYAANLPPILGDAGMIGQILLNLAVNARDAMPQGGRLILATDLVDVDPAHIQRQPSARVGCFVRLSVQDTGSGIAPVVLPHIFEPFFTTKDVGKGTGLGLATAYGIAQQHSGWIEVESASNAGTSFHVFIPALDPSPSISTAPPDRPSVARGTGIILVVEDDAGVRALAKLCLERIGYVVLEAADGNEALEIWRTRSGEVDLVLTDLVMPGGISGRELAGRLRAERSNLKIIFTSGYSTDMPDPEEWDAGALFLPKPYEMQALAKTVRDCLDAERAGEWI